MSAAAVSIRKAVPDDAAGVAAVLNGAILGGSPTLLDTPFSVEEERAYIEHLPARSFVHVAETPAGDIVGFQTVIPWSTFATTAFDHVATMGTYVDAAHRRRGVGAALARAASPPRSPSATTRSSPTCAPTTSTRWRTTSPLGFAVAGAARRAGARARPGRRRPVHRTLPEGGVTVLYVCATPIGNLGDVTPRVLEALREAELVAAEDTRRTRKLLSHFDIHTPLTSFFQHNELQKTDEVCGLLRDGATVALVTDAGMPGVQDPGMLLVQKVVSEGLEMTVLPGPSAVLTALVAAGLGGDGFRFVGYLPRRARELEAALKAWQRVRRPGGRLRHRPAAGAQPRRAWRRTFRTPAPPCAASSPRCTRRSCAARCSSSAGAIPCRVPTSARRPPFAARSPW